MRTLEGSYTPLFVPCLVQRQEFKAHMRQFYGISVQIAQRAIVGYDLAHGFGLKTFDDNDFHVDLVMLHLLRPMSELVEVELVGPTSH